MSDGRREILERIANGNRALGADVSDARARLRERPLGPQPQWGEAAVERFAGRLERAAATVGRIADRNALAAEVAAYLERQGIAPEIVLAPHPLLDGLDWPDGVTAERRALRDTDTTVLSVAFAGVAETGSLLMPSRPETPTGFNFLPDNFLCVIEAQRIVDHLEDAWTRIRDELGGMPRSLNFVTGPSRTADVEQTIQLGAHGPRRLHAILLDG
ncbi:MAG: lactate utilization protein [Chromatiales bacterium]|jgi:L-lactate dehydrogenase complex protein LldG